MIRRYSPQDIPIVKVVGVLRFVAVVAYVANNELWYVDQKRDNKTLAGLGCVEGRCSRIARAEA